MSGTRYPEEFKIEGVRQVTDRGRSVAQVGYRKPRHKAGCVHKVAPNILQRHAARADVFDYIGCFTPNVDDTVSTNCSRR